jgi:hypothetical protein
MSGEASWTQKALVLEKTLNGNVMFAWLTDESRPETVIETRHWGSRASVAVNRLFGSPRSNWMLYGFVLSCLCVPWLWFTSARRPVMFVLVYLLVTWGQMLILPNTGATLHHVILLWPFPHLLVAIAGAELSQSFGRYALPALATALVLVLTSNIALINHYYTDIITKGTTVIWTDAVYPLFEFLDSSNPSRVVTVDWGYATTLCLLSDGEMPLDDISFTLLNPSEAESAWIQTLMTDPRNLFVNNTNGGEQFKGINQHLESIAAKAGIKKEVVRTITDRNHRPRFEVARYIVGR